MPYKLTRFPDYLGTRTRQYAVHLTSGKTVGTITETSKGWVATVGLGRNTVFEKACDTMTEAVSALLNENKETCNG